MSQVLDISNTFGDHSENLSKADFFDSWGYVSQVLKMVDGARYYRVRESTEKYKNGSPVYLCYFLNEKKDKLLSTHKAMKLFSKKTNTDYFVVMKNQIRKKFSTDDERSLDEALDKLLS